MAALDRPAACALPPTDINPRAIAATERLARRRLSMTILLMRNGRRSLTEDGRVSRDTHVRVRGWEEIHPKWASPIFLRDLVPASKWFRLKGMWITWHARFSPLCPRGLPGVSQRPRHQQSRYILRTRGGSYLTEIARKAQVLQPWDMRASPSLAALASACHRPPIVPFRFCHTHCE